MPQRSENKEKDFSGRVLAASTELAHLSLHTATLRFSPPEVRDQFATELIRRLVGLCGAWQGGIFLMPSQGATNLQAIFAHQLPVSLIASVQMSAEEAHIALARYPLTTAPLQWSVDLPPTLVWSRSLVTPQVSLEHPEQDAASPMPQVYVFLLLAWPVQEQHFEARDEAMQILPLLADTIDTILFHLFIAGREQDVPEELLPAEVLATVGHEFRGPLTTISGYATTLLQHDQQLTPQERQEFLKTISDASTHLGKLVDRFLELAQFEMNTVSFVPTAVDIVALAREAIMTAKRPGGHPLLLTPHIADERPLREGREQVAGADEWTIAGDRRWLRTMLDLLLENAIAYSPPERLIEVSIEPVDPSSSPTALAAHLNPDSQKALILPGMFGEQETLIEIQVRDHGRGIAPEHLSRIFQRFYRVDTRLTREVNGLGLGLALCKAIVARHRGMLWVESVFAEGSAFHILLPRVATPATRETIQKETKEDRNEHDRQKSPHRDRR